MRLVKVIRVSSNAQIWLENGQDIQFAGLAVVERFNEQGLLVRELWPAGFEGDDTVLVVDPQNPNFKGFRPYDT